MIIVTFGSDTYGRVKRVGKTAIVTKFGMLQFMPVFPLESFFYARRGNVSRDLISLLFGIDATSARAIPLARIDWLSVAMAYYRGACGALALVGSISLIPVVMHFSGERLDNLAIVFTQVLLLCLGLGIAGGALSYCLPGQVGSRQKAIRSACGDVLGMDVDPASFRRDFANELESLLSCQTESKQLQEADRSPETDERVNAGLELVRTRLQISQGGQREPLERRSDDLLERIRRLTRFQA